MHDMGIIWIFHQKMHLSKVLVIWKARMYVLIILRAI
jgi:hypothetical protein